MWMFLTYFVNARRRLQAESGVQPCYSIGTQVFLVIRDFLTAHLCNYSGLLSKLTYKLAWTDLMHLPRFK